MNLDYSVKENLLNRLKQSSLTVMYNGELHTIYMDEEDNCHIYMIDHSREGNIGYGITAEQVTVCLLYKHMYIV